MKRKEFIGVAIPAIWLLANGKIVKAEDYLSQRSKKLKLRFVVASDGHYGQPETDYARFFDTLVTRINEEHGAKAFSFCVINGDIIHDDRSHFPAAKLALDQLAMQYYVSQGNHDHVSAADWQAIWNMPVNTSFSHGDTSFLVVTTSNEEGIYLCPDTEWLQQKLEENRHQKNIFIFMHINPAKLTKYGVDCKPLHDLFAKHRNIRAVFNGHDHDEEGIKTSNNIPFVFDGHFGGNWGTDYRGFRVVELMDDNSVLTYLMDPVKKINEAKLER